MGARHVDTVIVGGAIMGSAVAYYLTEHPDHDETVMVVERDPTYAKASTPLSGGSIRHQFSTPLNISVSQYCTEVIARWSEMVAVDGECPELGFRDTGYLFLYDEQRRASFESIHETQRACGAEVTLLDVEQLTRRFGHIDPTGLVGASLGERHEGTLDPWAFMTGFKQRARHNGATFVDAHLAGIDTGYGRVTGVELASGERVTCRRVVNCSGVRADEVANMVGLSVPVEARSRCTFVFDCRTPPQGPFPLTIDISGVHVRREGTQFLAGGVPRVDGAVDPEDTAVREAEFDEIIWPALAGRIPVFDRINLTASWGGHYAMNTLDHNMIVGASPVEGFYFCNGFSGHGLQQAPAVGRGVAELIVDGSYRSIDLSPLGYDRIVRNEPLLETAVI